MSKPPLPADVAQIIEESIVQMADAMKRMASTRLSRKTLVVLLMHDTKLGMGTVEQVLDSLENLESKWLKKRS